jgi:hypothetical protein
MNLFEITQEALQDRAVVDTVQRCIEENGEYGFIIYAGDNREIKVGGAVKNSVGRIRKFKFNQFDDMKNVGYWRERYELARDKSDSYMKEFLMRNENPDPSAGVLISTNWRVNIMDEETYNYLRGALSRKGELNNPTTYLSIPRYYDTMKLNILKNEFPRAVAVRGEKTSEDSNLISLLIVEQKVPQMELGQLAAAEIATTFSEIPEMNRKSEIHYRISRGIYDLEKRQVYLDSDHEID